MRLERQHHRGPAGGVGCLPHRLDQDPVAAVDAVEIADRRHRARERGRYRLVRAADREGPRGRLVAWGHRSFGIGYAEGLA